MIAPPEEPKLEDTTLEPEKDTPQPATRTVPTLAGYTNLQKLKIEGFLMQQSVIILIDTGSTHNFMSSKVFAHLMLQKEDYNGDFTSSVPSSIGSMTLADWFGAKELEAEIKRMRTELESLRSQRGELEQEVGLLRSNLDGARNDRARLEGDVLSLTEAASLLEVKLKVEGQKAVATYKGSRGFESGLEKMRRVSYEFGYRVVLE
ncbi:hypothetical protein B296_00000879 [Ensete ventricosum]|uniref:Uncharacterized protein n=1 Tax=Ensete ventricosum TaxID=4639 RepID=A0A426ZGM3_ENSVE|nr:hypothetical protein B296_00000879 [Ensete ventricosum]